MIIIMIIIIIIIIIIIVSLFTPKRMKIFAKKKIYHMLTLLQRLH